MLWAGCARSSLTDTSHLEEPQTPTCYRLTPSETHLLRPMTMKPVYTAFATAQQRYSPRQDDSMCKQGAGSPICCNKGIQSIGIHTDAIGHNSSDVLCRRMAELQRKQEGKLTMAEEVLEAEETGEEPPSQGESPAKPHAAIDIAAAIALALLTALFIALTAVDNSPKHAAR